MKKLQAKDVTTCVHVKCQAPLHLNTYVHTYVHRTHKYIKLCINSSLSVCLNGLLRYKLDLNCDFKHFTTKFSLYFYKINY